MDKEAPIDKVDPGPPGGVSVNEYLKFNILLHYFL